MEVVIHVADVLIMSASLGRFVNAAFARRPPQSNEFAPRRIKPPRAWQNHP
jgi:hypothetical protein